MFVLCLLDANSSRGCPAQQNVTFILYNILRNVHVYNNATALKLHCKCQKLTAIKPTINMAYFLHLCDVLIGQAKSDVQNMDETGFLVGGDV